MPPGRINYFLTAHCRFLPITWSAFLTDGLELVLAEVTKGPGDRNQGGNSPRRYRRPIHCAKSGWIPRLPECLLALV